MALYLVTKLTQKKEVFEVEAANATAAETDALSDSPSGSVTAKPESGTLRVTSFSSLKPE